MTAPRKGSQASPALVEHWAGVAAHVVARAAEEGVLITVERRPLWPLAMGNAAPVVEARAEWRN